MMSLMSTESRAAFGAAAVARGESLRAARRAQAVSDIPDRYQALWFSTYIFQAFAVVVIVAMAVLAVVLPLSVLARLGLLVVGVFGGVLVYGFSEFILLLLSIERSLRLGRDQ
jgi:hypothetical protein